MEKKKTQKKKTLQKRLKEGYKEFKSDVNKLRKGELEPRIFKKKPKVPNPTEKFARNLTGRGGDPVSTSLKGTGTSTLEKSAAKYAKKLSGKKGTSPKTTTKKTVKKTRKK